MRTVFETTFPMSCKDDMFSQRVSDAFSVMDRFPHPFLLERGAPASPARRQVSFRSWLRAHDRSRSLSRAEMQILEKQGHIWFVLHPQQCFAQVLAESTLGAGLLKSGRGSTARGLGVSMTVFAPEALTHPLGWIVPCLSSIQGSS